jgi:hypothetical protein
MPIFHKDAPPFHINLYSPCMHHNIDARHFVNELQCYASLFIFRYENCLIRQAFQHKMYLQVSKKKLIFKNSQRKIPLNLKEIQKYVPEITKNIYS